MIDLQAILQVSSARHKHLCPRQVLGARIALAGAAVLRLELPRTDKRLLVIVETDGCFADGVEVATACTVGHRTLRVEEEALEVDEAQVEARLEANREQHAGWTEVTHPSAYGDMLNIDVKSVLVTEDGAENAEETVVLNETDWDVTPDQENPIEPAGFDEELLGLKAGDDKEFILAWPAEGQSIHAGKRARFAGHFKHQVAQMKRFEAQTLGRACARHQ